MIKKPEYEKRCLCYTHLKSNFEIKKTLIGMRTYTDKDGDHYEYEGVGKESESWQPESWMELPHEDSPLWEIL